MPLITGGSDSEVIMASLVDHLHDVRWEIASPWSEIEDEQPGLVELPAILLEGRNPPTLSLSKCHIVDFTAAPGLHEHVELFFSQIRSGSNGAPVEGLAL